MKILLPAVAASSHPDGVSRHAANLAQCLLLNEQIERVDLVVGEWQYHALRSMLEDSPRLRVWPVALRNSSLTRNRWYWTELPKFAEKLESDLVHAAYPIPVHKSAFPCPILITLHDLYPYDAAANFGFPKVFVNRAILRQCLHKVDAIACVSESTFSRLDVYAPEVVAKAVTIYNYVATSVVMSSQSPIPGWTGEPFVLCVAQHRRNKNLLLSIAVFDKLRREGELAAHAQLVIVGAEGPDSPAIYQLVREMNLVGSVVFLRGISDPDLHWCYGHCELLLMPSSVEGFGLPVVEAMMHQCRVVCSDIAVLREVGGTYCHYAQLNADALQNFVTASRMALRNHKFRTAPMECFSQAKVAKAYLRLYVKLCNAALNAKRPAKIHGITLIQEGK